MRSSEPPASSAPPTDLLAGTSPLRFRLSFRLVLALWFHSGLGALPTHVPLRLRNRLQGGNPLARRRLKPFPQLRHVVGHQLGAIARPG